MRGIITGSSGRIGTALQVYLPDFELCSRRIKRDYRKLQGHFDVVVHLGGYANGDLSPTEYYDNNITGLVEFLTNCTIGHMVFASTAGWYPFGKALERDAHWKFCNSPYLQTKFQ